MKTSAATAGCIALGLMLSCLGSVVGAATFHVAVSGDDANPGTRNRPFATPHRARDAVRAAKEAGPVEVILAAGTYELSKPLELTAADSGTAASPITWRAASGAEVRLVGGRMVRGFAPVTDARVLARLPEAARGQVLRADLRGQGVGDYGDMRGGFDAPGGGPGMELFLNDRPMTIARYPNEGFLRIKKVLGETPKVVRGTGGCVEGIYVYEGDRPARWVGEKDPRVHGYWFWDWADRRQRIASIDPKAQVIRLAPPWHGYGYRAGQWFYGFNLLCEIDRPGEWYLDREDGIAYVWPVDGKRPRRAMVSVLPAVVTMTGTAHVTLRGLTLEGARGHGVVAKDCTDCRIAGCTVRNLGSWAVRVDGGRNVQVVGCDVTGTGDGGISLRGGDRKTLAPAGHVAANNHVHRYSRWNRTYRPGLSLNGVGCRAANNLIHHAPHQAVAFGGNEHVIERNEIHNVCQETNDAGVMYGWNDWAARGHVIRHNFIHHVYGHEARGCMGVYLDDCFSSAHLVGNVFWIVPRAAFIGGGRDNVFENNVFVDCAPALHVDARGLGWRAYGKPGLTQKLEAQPYRTEPWKSRYPQLLTLLADEPMAPKGNVIARNICVGGKWDNIDAKARPYLTLKDNLIDVDPGFEDAKRGNFRLRADSPAWKAGFQRIPLEKIGLYADETRASWPVAHPFTVQERKTGPGSTHHRPHAHAVKPLAVPRVQEAPRIDGTIEQSEWPGRALPIAETPGRQKIPTAACALGLAHDGKTLYVAVSVPIRQPSKLVTGREWGACDGVEVCFRAHDSKEPGPVFILQGFPDGRMAASTDAGAPKAASEKLAGAARFAAKIRTNGWSCEWAVPLANAGITGQRGRKLGFNVGIRRMETGEWIAWAGALSQNWRLDNAGVIVLD